ncbi:MAG: hypothetical protein IBJ03_08015 [Gemmatimonadaceae bacterium]|nr:hypothetical protein [Gemmatimonadaceae bacterium]
MTLLSASLSALAAQPVMPQGTMAWMDVGGARVQQPQSSLRTAGSFGAGVWHGRSRWSIASEGTATLADDSLAATQWVLRTSFAPASRLRTDIDLAATTNGLVMPGVNGNRSVSGRQSVLFGPISVFGVAGTGRTERFLMTSRGNSFSAGTDWQTSHRSGLWRVAVTGQRAFTDDWMLMEASGLVLIREAAAYTLDDISVDMSWRTNRFSLGASRSWRKGAGATSGSARGHSITAAWQATPSVMLIAQGGEQLADVVRGVPQALYTGVGVRWNPLRVRGVQREARAFADTRNMAPNVVPELRGDEVLLQRREGEGVLTITVLAMQDAVVEIASSANEWTPTRVSHSSAGFVHKLTLSSGTHRVAVRVNGGEWRAPRGLVAVDDEFGGKAGLVVVP